MTIAHLEMLLDTNMINNAFCKSNQVAIGFLSGHRMRVPSLWSAWALILDSMLQSTSFSSLYID